MKNNKGEGWGVLKRKRGLINCLPLKRGACSRKGAYLIWGGLIEDLRYVRNLCTKVSPGENNSDFSHTADVGQTENRSKENCVGRQSKTFARIKRKAEA